jgi:membrane-bound metal-dependent hydrolase YbcI (DUF457 family)
MIATGNSMLYLHETIGGIMGIAFASGALLYNIGFIKTKLVPRYLSIWGMAAAVMHILACVLTFYGYESFSPLNMVLNVPIAIQEMVMAVYLIIFGFRNIDKEII